VRLATARTLDRTAALLFTIILSANTYRFPSPSFWEVALRDHAYAVPTLLAATGFFIVFRPAETLTERSRSARSVTTRQQILTAFGRLLELGRAVTPPLGISDLGLHVWTRHRTLRHPVGGVLIRIATYRVGTNPMNRPFSPPKGVGVVGLCWKHNHEVGVDVESLAKLLLDRDQFQKYRENNDPDSVMNFTWDQFNMVKHRGAVFAFPIRNDRNRFVGCLSVDASHGFAALDQPELKAQMSLLTVVIGQAGLENA
jgi:hypothetical protein